MGNRTACFVSCLLAAWSPAQSPPLAAKDLPVVEVTSFKDGHAYVVRERTLPPDHDGQVVLTGLPAPVLGTFWPYATNGARLVAARAGRDKVAREVAAMDFRQIARANVGKPVLVVTADKERIEGELLGVPSLQDVPAASDGELLLVRTAQGTRALALGSVRELEVRGDFTRTIRSEEEQERLTLQVAGGGDGARVGVMYVQKGLRWIPAYRIDIDGAGKASVRLEATLVNDLIDLQRATVNLVVGVPKFAFAGRLDPISLQQEAAQVSSWGPQQAAFDNALSNALMTQAAGRSFSGASSQSADEPKVDGAETNEDLFVFTVRDVTLAKGERLVVPVASYELGYTDLYRLELPLSPPPDVRQSWASQQQLEVAKQQAAPKVRHVLRLQNGAEAPLTTAPALVLRAGKVLAQGLMTYTPKGTATDLEINVAVDVRADSEERETKRDPGNLRVGTDQYGRVDLAGTTTVKNGKSTPIRIEVTRRVLGITDSVGQDGSLKQLDLLAAWPNEQQPAWWGWWSWPWWWFQHNGFGEFRWETTIPAGGSVELTASWHYFWR